MTEDSGLRDARFAIGQISSVRLFLFGAHLPTLRPVLTSEASAEDKQWLLIVLSRRPRRFGRFPRCFAAAL
jgi:hypothetical protein